MNDDEELSAQEEINRLKREATTIDARRNARLKEAVKEQQALGKSAAEALEYVKRQDEEYKNLTKQLSAVKSAVKEYSEYVNGISESLVRHEETLTSLSGLQSSIAEGERQRLQAQAKITSLSSEFHDSLNDVGTTTAQLSNLSKEDSVSRGVLIQQTQSQLDESRAMLEIEKERHQAVIDNYNSEFNRLQQKIETERAAYEAAMAQQQSLSQQQNTLQDEMNARREELLMMEESLSEMSPDDAGYEAVRQRAEALRYEIHGIDQELKNVGQRKAEVDQLTHSFEQQIERAEEMSAAYQTSSDFMANQLSHAEAALEIAEQNLQMATDISNMTEKQQEFLEEQLELYDGIKDAIAKVWETASLLFSGWRGFVGTTLIGLGTVINRVTDVNKELGLAVRHTNSFSLSIAGLGMFFDDAQETAEELASQLGGMDEAGFGLQLKTNLIASNLGISGQEAATLVGEFSRLNSGSTDVALNMMKSTRETARMAGVIPSKVMKDLANNTEAFAEYGKDGGKNIAEAAIYAQKLGVTMDKLTTITDNLLDFESSITGELELSAMLGRNINLDRARQLAYEEDIEGAVNETLNQLGGIDAFNQMDIYAKREAAKLLGISVGELQKMAENQGKVNEKVGFMEESFDTISSSWEAFNTSKLGTTFQLLGGMLMGLHDFKNGVGDIKESWGDFQSAFQKTNDDSRGFFERVKDGIKNLMGFEVKKPEVQGMPDGSIKPDIPMATTVEDKGISETLKDTGKGAEDVAGGGKELEKTKSIGEKLKDLAGGLEAMGTGKVLAGALNLIPTGIGFLLMLPGIPSLFLLSKIDVSKVGEGLGSLAEGLESMGTGKVLFGAINLIPAGIGFALMTLGFIGMGIIALLGIPLGAGLTAMAAGLTAMGNPAVFMGALGILAVGAALLPFTFALSLLQGVDVGVILATVGALVVFGFAAAAIGTVLPLIAMGSLGIGLISLALIPFTFALSQLQGVDPSILLTTALALGVFGLSASVFGVLSPLIILGSYAIATLGLALIPFTFALSKLIGLDPTIIDTISSSLIKIGMASLMISAGIALLTVSILALGFLSPFLIQGSIVFAAFAGVLLLFAMASSILSLTLPTVTESLKQMVEFTDGIFGLSAAILALAGSLTTLSFASLVMLPLIPVLATIGAISSLFGGGGEGGEAGAEEGGTLSSLESTVREVNEALLSEIKGLRDDLNSGKISVNMDGDKVTSKIVTNINRSASNGYGIK